jgi:hypothetical protein
VPQPYQGCCQSLPFPFYDQQKRDETRGTPRFGLFFFAQVCLQAMVPAKEYYEEYHGHKVCAAYDFGLLLVAQVAVFVSCLI